MISQDTKEHIEEIQAEADRAPLAKDISKMRLQKDMARVMAAMREEPEGPEPPDRAQIAKDIAQLEAELKKVVRKKGLLFGKMRTGNDEPSIEEVTRACREADAAMGGEMDPNGKSPNEAGAKLDFGKLQADSLLGAFAHALEAVAEVGEFGAVKYSLHGWLEVPDGKQRYSEALIRHWLDDKKGEITDRDSGLLVKAHLAWNALAVLELELRQRDA